jgi:hypothetical protein
MRLSQLCVLGNVEFFLESFNTLYFFVANNKNQIREAQSLNDVSKLNYWFFRNTSIRKITGTIKSIVVFVKTHLIKGFESLSNFRSKYRSIKFYFGHYITLLLHRHRLNFHCAPLFLINSQKQLITSSPVCPWEPTSLKYQSEVGHELIEHILSTRMLRLTQQFSLKEDVLLRYQLNKDGSVSLDEEGKSDSGIKHGPDPPESIALVGHERGGIVLITRATTDEVVICLANSLNMRFNTL